MGRMVLMPNMQMERRRVGTYCYDNQLDQALLMESTPPSKCYSSNSSPAASRPCSFPSAGGRPSGCGGDSNTNGGGLGYIEHTISKYDTLVGVAIKYGVEVVDIKRMNGLIVDQQMFALKSLQIPLQGRYLPSPIMSNGATKLRVTHASDKHSDLFKSIESLNLSSSCQCNGTGESFEMTVYREGSASENERKTSRTSNLFFGDQRKSKFIVNGGLEKGEVSLRNDKNDGFDKLFEKLVRRRNGKNTIH